MTRSVASRFLLFHSVSQTSTGDGMVIGRHEFDRLVAKTKRQAKFGLSTQITFDDGYQDNLHVAASILESHRQPAIFFVSGNSANHQEPFWWEEFPRLIAHAEVNWLELEVGDHQVRIDIRTAAGRERAKRYCTKTLRDSPPDQLAQVRDQLRHVAPDVRADCPARLSEKDIGELAANPLFEIGGHTADHAYLSSLSAAEVALQVESNLDWLESTIDKRPTKFAYPFGNRPSINQMVVDTVRDCGITTAFVNWPGLCTPRTDRLRIPRTIGG